MINKFNISSKKKTLNLHVEEVWNVKTHQLFRTPTITSTILQATSDQCQLYRHFHVLSNLTIQPTSHKIPTDISLYWPHFWSKCVGFILGISITKYMDSYSWRYLDTHVVFSDPFPPSFSLLLRFLSIFNSSLFQLCKVKENNGGIGNFPTPFFHICVIIPLN